MTNEDNDISRRKAALAAGFGLLIMAVFAIYADFFVFKKLISPGNASLTVNNILAHASLFRIGICSFLVVIVCDIVVAWALYVFLKPVNKSLSLLTAWFRLVYAAIFGIALGNYLASLQLLSGADYVSAIEPNQLHAQVMLSINAFNDGWAVGYVFFSFHLGLLGYLVFKSRWGLTTRILGVLLVIGGAGYLIDYIGRILFPHFNMEITMITGWGELLFMFWLLFAGGKGTTKAKAA